MRAPFQVFTSSADSSAIRPQRQGAREGFASRSRAFRFLAPANMDARQAIHAGCMASEVRDADGLLCTRFEKSGAGLPIRCELPR